MANIFRRLLADAIRKNGGYSRFYRDSFPLEFNVGLYYADTSKEHIYKKAVSDVGALAPMPANFAWDESAEWESAQWHMAHGLNDDDANRTISPRVAKICGFEYHNPRPKYSRIIRGKDCAYYPARLQGWKIENPYSAPTFECEFGLYGRCGKHLCVESFEGVKFSGITADDLADAIENDDSGNYSNSWCRLLYAAILEWETTFTARNASAELEYQLALSLHERISERADMWRAALRDARKAKAAAKREALAREYWESRDIVTKGA